jgi:hypothetical protein
MTITGVTGDGAASVNGSWKARPINWTNGATDWVLTGSSFNGSPIRGMINKVDQLDMYIQRISVWSCKDWQTSNCNVSSLPAAPSGYASIVMQLAWSLAHWWEIISF